MDKRMMDELMRRIGGVPGFAIPLGESHEDDERKDIPGPMPEANAIGQAAVLRDRFKELSREHRFKPGDLVTWKDGWCHAKYPAPGQPAVVIDTFYEEPIMDDKAEAGTPYYLRRIDIRIACIDGNEGVCLPFVTCSKYFKPWED